jgi:wyosine [tRNA(Phe)-imidazoG37] synthetase (radical SAM superfamily)
MFCEILQTLYVKSNGLVVCNDDFGERVTLGRIDHGARNWNIVEALLENEQYSHIRSAFQANELPWPDVCSRCSLLRRDDPYIDRLRNRYLIRVQIEVSLACNLRCPYCVNHIQIREKERRPFLMPLEVFERTLTSLRNERFQIELFDYLGQGDPLMHPEFTKFVELARRIYPESKQRLVTNGNFDYAKTCGSAVLDEIVVSIDGFFQESYARYRVGGQVTKALQFLEDAAAAASVAKHRTEVIWKYIVFEWNDTKEELTAAQRYADTLPIEKLQFIFTHSLGRSQRFRPERPFFFPMLSRKTEFHNTCQLDMFVDYGTLSASNLDPGCINSAPFFLWLEEASVYNQDLFRLKGWVVSRSNTIEKLHFFLDGQPICTTDRLQWRSDVFKFFPYFPEQNSQFRVLVDARGLALHSGVHQVTIVPHDQDGPLGEYRQRVLLKSAGATETTMRYASFGPAVYEQRLGVHSRAERGVDSLPLRQSIAQRARWGSYLLAARLATKVEEMSLFHRRYLKVRGWALARRRPITRLDLSLNGRRLGSVTEFGSRHDVLRAWRTFPAQPSAFQLEVDLGETGNDNEAGTITSSVFVGDDHVGTEQQTFRFDLTADQFLLRH